MNHIFPTPNRKLFIHSFLSPAPPLFPRSAGKSIIG